MLPGYGIPKNSYDEDDEELSPPTLRPDKIHQTNKKQINKWDAEF